jgi:hypothetical protein
MIELKPLFTAIALYPLLVLCAMWLVSAGVRRYELRHVHKGRL